MDDLCFIDIETTGSVFGYHEIVEVAALRTTPDASLIRGAWHTRVRPRHPGRITPRAQELNGFNEEAWASARASDQSLWREFSDFVAGCVPVCHNPSFDRAFISLAAVAEGVEDLGVRFHWIGTESLAWPFYQAGQFPVLSLAHLCDFFNIEREPMPHHALGGAHACRSVYVALMAHLLARAPSEGRPHAHPHTH
ncbi:MAG TPA: 3'-5' exonuclease [Pyrinomonadaceae bacterium]|jgi:DNA polymerase III epsilon subunit-like protein